jgi:hypothetical protein
VNLQTSTRSRALPGSGMAALEVSTKVRAAYCASHMGSVALSRASGQKSARRGCCTPNSLGCATSATRTGSIGRSGSAPNVGAIPAPTRCATSPTISRIDTVFPRARLRAIYPGGGKGSRRGSVCRDLSGPAYRP